MNLDLETARLRVRPFRQDDGPHLARLFGDPPEARDDREQWLRWSVLNYQLLDRMKQPPYGDYAVDERASGRLIGACGLVPCLAPFAQLLSGVAERYTTEVGLFYEIDPGFRCRGYALEAASALVDYARRELVLDRIVAATSHDNLASQSVMRRLGMTLRTNPLPDPFWFQVVGTLSLKDRT